MLHSLIFLFKIVKGDKQEMVHHLYIAKQRELLDRKIKEDKRICINIWNLSHVNEHSCIMLWLPTKAFSPIFLFFKTAPEITHHLTRGWPKNNEEWILRIGVLDKITVNCYHGSSVRERLICQGCGAGAFVGCHWEYIQFSPAAPQRWHGSLWLQLILPSPLLGCTLALIATQPRGTTRTEKQAKWLVFKEYREILFLWNNIQYWNQEFWKECVWISNSATNSSVIVLNPQFKTIGPTRGVGPFHQQLSWISAHGASLKSPGGRCALIRAQASAGMIVHPTRIWRVSPLPSTFFSAPGFKDHITQTTQVLLGISSLVM